jgi:CheY-like chemotaxis protein
MLRFLSKKADSPCGISVKGLMEEKKETAVLIVDDSKQYSLVLQTMLKGAFGYTQVLSCEDIDSAYLTMKSAPERFQMLFVDYNFPDGRTGADFLKKLRDDGLIGQKSIFLITADPTDQNFKLAQEFGAVGMVAKPFDRAQLALQLDKAARAKELDDQSW